MVWDVDAAAAQAASGAAPTSANFHVQPGATAQDLADLDAALSYLNTSSHAQPTLQHGIADPNLKIVIIHNGQDGFDPNTDTLYWDPHSGLRLVNGKIQSAALGFLHELAHHEAPPNQVRAPDPQYDNTEERRVITGVEAAVAIDLGEPLRWAHTGEDVYEQDPTAHDDSQSPPPFDSELDGFVWGDRAGDDEDDDDNGLYWSNAIYAPPHFEFTGQQVGTY